MTARPVIYHRVAELWGVEKSLLNHASKLHQALDKLAIDLQINVVRKFTHKFEPHGLSVVWVLSESHLAIHTWPEYGYLHFDIVSCAKEADLSKLPKALKDAFHPKILKCRKVA